MKYIYRLLSIFMWIGIGFSLNSCHIFYIHLFEPSYPYVDISDDPRMQHLVGQWLELKQPVFLYQYSDTKTYSLNIEGISSSLPHSIIEYQKDPLNWQYTDYNAQQGFGPAEGYDKHKVIDVIPRGTKIYVAKIMEKQTLYESFIEVIAYIDDPAYSNLCVDIYFLLEKKYGEVIIPYPNEPERTVMGSKIILYPKPGVIEYCQEVEENK